MSNFISPFLSRIIYVSCSLSTLITTASRVKSTTTSSTYSQIEQKLNHLRSSMATLIPLRLLLPIFNENSNLSQASSLTYRITLKNIEFYMQMVVVATRTVSQEDLLTNIRLVRSMFMNLFEIRTVLMTEFKASTTKKSSSEAKIFKFASDLCKYEDHVIEAFSELVIKLSEDLFKPIFFKLFEWATMNEAPKDRLITFYRTTLKLSHKLKNLFVLFAFQFIPNASANLELLNSSKADESFFESENSKREGLLLYSIVDTLSTVFMNDSQKTFANKDCFKLLIQPLVDQIDNELEYDDYPEFIRTHLAPCIANLATCCVQDDALSRKFNYQILLKTKSSSVQVRLATLNVLNLFSKKIGDIYNSYLSETVPFLAELMEDPVEEVEEKVQDLIKELEEMLGESLQSHFV